MPMFQVTHRQAVNDPNGERDDLVQWVLARNLITVVRVVGDSGADVSPMSLTPDQCLPDVDFVLPREARALRDFCRTEHEHANPRA